MIFRLRTEMLVLQDNIMDRYKTTDTNCEPCEEHVPEYQAHVMVYVLLDREKRKLTTLCSTGATYYTFPDNTFGWCKILWCQDYCCYFAIDCSKDTLYFEI